MLESCPPSASNLSFYSRMRSGGPYTPWGRDGFLGKGSRFAIQTQKARSEERALLENNAGDNLISHTLSRAVPSAQRGLTSVFGMGTGGTLAVWSPANLRRFLQHVTPSKTWTALGRLFLLQPGLIYGLFLPDKKRQTGATQPNISQRNRLVYYRAC